MSPQARDRAREKRRREKRQAVLDQRARDSRRNKQVLGIVLVMVLLIGGFIGLTFALNSGSKTTASSAASAYSPGYGYGIENPPANFTYPAGTLAMARTQDPNFTYPAGTLAMARTQDPKSNGGQFFIVHKDTTINDPAGYSIFGKITSGLDIVDKIAAAGAHQPDATQNTAPLQPISILAVNVTQKKA